MDFVSDTLSTGQRFRCLIIMDEFSPACLTIHVARSIPSVRVIEVLERLRADRGLPEVIMTDNGSEFTSRAFDAWANSRGVRIDHIQPGNPVQNCFIEGFNVTFRKECLNLHWFLSLKDAQQEVESWIMDYNQERPHSSLGRLTPADFAGLHQHRKDRLTVKLDQLWESPQVFHLPIETAGSTLTGRLWSDSGP